MTLTNTLIDGRTAYPGQVVVFTCVTRHSHILQWNSTEYINGNGDNNIIQIFDGISGTNVSSGDARGILTSVTTENGVPVLISELHITASARYPRATVECNNNGHGSSQSITFGMTIIIMMFYHCKCMSTCKQ